VTDPEIAPIRLGPRGWWTLVAVAVLVLAFLLGPVVMLALHDDLDREVIVIPQEREPVVAPGR
jgi:hypothetical protein